jgi:hypothetical protein
VGGRFQEGGTPEVMKRLKEITVDPRTVSLAKKIDAAAVGVPKLVDGALAAGTFSYAGTLASGAQSMPITMTRTVKQDAGGWVVTDAAKMAMGEMSETATYAKGTLAPMKRSIRQGPVAIEIVFDGSKATGTMAMGAAPKPIAVDLGGAVFADGAGSHETLARLPLADGYSVTFRNLDIQRQKASLRQMRVLGTDEVKVPAGKFSCWKVDLSSAEGEPGTETFWVDKASKKIVKTAATIPEMGNATLTVELQN